MSPRPIRAALLAAISTLACAACGGETHEPSEVASMDREEALDPAPPATATDLSTVRACELLTAAEIEATTGLAPAAPEDQTQLDGQLPMCTWPAADPAGNPVVNLLLSRSAGPTYEEIVESARGEDGEAPRLERVEGVGDVAAWLGDDPAGGMLQAHERGLAIQVTARTAPGTDQRAAAVALARAALARVE